MENTPHPPIFYKIQIIIVIAKKKKAKKQKMKEMYTGAPEKCLEVFALTKKKMLSNTPVQNNSSTPRQNHKNKEQNHNILIINNYNFTIF